MLSISCVFRKSRQIEEKKRRITPSLTAPTPAREASRTNKGQQIQSSSRLSSKPLRGGKACCAT